MSFVSYLHLQSLSGDVSRSGGLQGGIVHAKVIPAILDLDDACNLSLRRLRDKYPITGAPAESFDHTHAVFVEVGSDCD